MKHIPLARCSVLFISRLGECKRKPGAVQAQINALTGPSSRWHLSHRTIGSPGRSLLFPSPVSLVRGTSTMWSRHAHRKAKQSKTSNRTPQSGRGHASFHQQHGKRLVPAAPAQDHARLGSLGIMNACQQSQSFCGGIVGGASFASLPTILPVRLARRHRSSNLIDTCISVYM